VYSSCSSSAMLLSDRRTSSANGACGRQARHDNDGMRLLIADHGCRSRVRRSTACVVRQAGQRTQRNQCLALRAQPIVGENSIGMPLDCRSFHAETRRPASSRICASVARFVAASFSAAAARCAFILRLLKPIAERDALDKRAVDSSSASRCTAGAACCRKIALTAKSSVPLHALGVHELESTPGTFTNLL
jgi:hypothetical protein